MESMLFKWAPALVTAIGIGGAATAGYLVYAGLVTQTERIQNRLRIKETVRESKDMLMQTAGKSSAEDVLKEAGYPLGLNGGRYFILYTSIVAFLVIYYILLPVVTGEPLSLITALLAIGAYILLMPSFPYSLFQLALKRVIEYRKSLQNQEIFMLYDLLISEIEMMQNTRISTYSILRSLRPYFSAIQPQLSKLLSSWSSTEGPSAALDVFAESIGTKDVRALATVLQTLDQNDRETALVALRSMNDMFVRSQIENYRRKRKLTTDLASLPIKITHFLILLNFLVVVVYMVSRMLESTHM